MERELIENLKKIKQIFDEINLRYWLDWGSLLGIIRDGKFIDWDSDIDIGTTSDNWEKLISAIHKFESKGFNVYVYGFRISDNIFERRFHICRSSFLIDVWCYDEMNRNALVHIMVLSKNLISEAFRILYSSFSSQRPYLRTRRGIFFFKFFKPLISVLPYKSREFLANITRWLCLRIGIKILLTRIPKHYFEKLEEKEFYGMTFNIPSDVKSYLELQYGKDWRTPKREWNLLKAGTVREIHLYGKD